MKTPLAVNSQERHFSSSYNRVEDRQIIFSFLIARGNIFFSVSSIPGRFLEVLALAPASVLTHHIAWPKALFFFCHGNSCCVSLSFLLLFHIIFLFFVLTSKFNVYLILTAHLSVDKTFLTCLIATCV